MQRSGFLPRRTPLRTRSRRVAHTYAKPGGRRDLVNRMLAERPWCERCHRARATDVHEVLSRARRGSILDEANLRCLCRACHTFITRHPAAAEKEGWLQPSRPPQRVQRTSVRQANAATRT